MTNIKKIAMKTIINVLVVLFLLYMCMGCINNTDSSHRYFYDSISGISFVHNSDWRFEVNNSNPYIVGHSPFAAGTHKTIAISLSDEEDLDTAVKTWWLGVDTIISNNIIAFDHPRINRYQGITYAANRARVAVSKENTFIDYRIFATRKNGKTIVLCELANIGCMDGFEGDCFAIVEKSINYKK